MISEKDKSAVLTSSLDSSLPSEFAEFGGRAIAGKDFKSTLSPLRIGECFGLIGCRVALLRGLAPTLCVLFFALEGLMGIRALGDLAPRLAVLLANIGNFEADFCPTDSLKDVPVEAAKVGD